MRFPGLRSVKKIWRKINQHGVILMYHRVCGKENTPDPWDLCVTPEHFEQQLQVLRTKTHPVSLTELSSSLKSLPRNHGKAVVTFDDGYRDNVLYAKPLLEKFGIPAAFFIVSGQVGKTREFWWDELERIILMAESLPSAFNMHIGSNPVTWIDNGRNTESRREFYRLVWKALKPLDQSQRSELIRSIRDWAGDNSGARETHLPVDIKQLNDLAASGLFEVGAHTVTHPTLADKTLAEQEKEISGSKAELESMTGKQVTLFSYPHGSNSPETRRAAKNAGFSCACSTEEVTVTRKADPFGLPRFMVRDWDGEEFERQLYNWAQLKG